MRWTRYMNDVCKQKEKNRGFFKSQPQINSGRRNIKTMYLGKS